MKEIIAVIRPERWPLTKTRLRDAGVGAFHVMRVYGRGRQRGLQMQGKGKRAVGISWMPKRLVTIWVGDGLAEKVVDVLIAANQTARKGDGKIFVSRVQGAMRVRTGEMGAEAL